jgi:predicted Zn-dependent protease
MYQPAQSVPAAAAPERPPRSLTESLSAPPAPRPGVVHEQPSRETLLSEARNAARASDHATAERRYRELWERFPDAPEPAGELADLYRRQGRAEDAATAYVEAARRLVRSGQAGRARALAGRLQAWSPQTAGVIYALVPPPTWSGSPSQPPRSLYDSLGR